MTTNKLYQSRERSSMIKLFYDYFVMKNFSMAIKRLSQS